MNPLPNWVTRLGQKFSSSVNLKLKANPNGDKQRLLETEKR